MAYSPIKSHDHTVDDDFDNKIIYSEAEKSSAIAKNECGVCKRKGFPLFLVRKAIVPKNYRNIDWSVGMISLGRNEKSLSDVYQYAYRTLRTGYVYILVKELDGVYRYMAYEVTPSGVFRHKSIEDVVEHNVRELPKQCTAKHDHIPGVFINIDRTRYSGAAYVGYSRRAWSKSALDTYRLAANSNNVDELKRFTTINLGEYGSSAPSPKVLGTVANNSPSRCFAFNNFNPQPNLLNLAAPAFNANNGELSNSQAKLMEVELASPHMIYYSNNNNLKQTLDTHQFERDSFITAHQFNSFKGGNLGSTLLYANHINLVAKLFTHAESLGEKLGTQVSAVVLDDPFAIAEELSLQRQLFIDPIMDLIENGEVDFNESTAEVFKDRLNSQRDIDKFDELIKQSIAIYYQTNPQDAQTMYGNEDDVVGDVKVDRNSLPKLSRVSYFDHLYQNMSSLYLKPYEADKAYFSEKSLHQRKIIGMINNYKVHLKDYFDNCEEFKYHRAFSYSRTVNTSSSQGSFVNFVDESKAFLAQPDLYQEVVISEEERQRLIASGQKEVGSYEVNYDGVRVFKSQSEISRDGKVQYDKELKKVQDHIVQKELDTFITKNNTHFTNIAKTVEKYSTDYFNYLGWLFGSEAKASPYLANLKSYNQIPFWLIESDQNCSNNHLGYLQDFIKMTDFNVLGGVVLSEQYGVWDTLLRDNQTLYYRLFNTDSEKSFWHLMIDARLKQDSDQTLKESGKNLTNAIRSVKAKHSNVLDSQFCDNKGKIILDLYQLIIQKSISGAAQRSTLNHDKSAGQLESVMDSDYFKTHLCQAMMVFNKTYARLVKVNVPLNETDDFFQYWSLKHGVFLEQNDDETLALINQISPYQTVGNGSYAAETKDSKQWGFTFLDLSNSVYSELGNKAAISVNIGMTKLTKAYRDEWQSLLKDPTKKGYGAEQARGAFLNSISLYLTFEGLNNDLAELEQAKDEQYGQHYKDRLIDSIQKAQVTFAAQTILALNSGLNLLTKGSRIVAYLAQGKSGLQMINQILKGGVASSSAALSLAASGVLGVMSILESIETFKSAKQLIDDGEYWTGKLLQVGAVVQGVIGVILLLQTFKIIPLSGLWAIGFMLGAALIALLVYIFRDKTQDWIPIEVWANRILFGNNEKPKKWPTYPPTVLGTGIATNDYLAAVQGLNCNIEFGQQHESAYINRLGALSDNQAELDREYNKFYTNMESTTDYQTRSRLEDDWYRYLENKLNLERSYLEGIHKAAWLNSGLRGDESNQYLTLAQNRAKAEAQERERSILKSKLKADAFYHTQGLYIQMTLPKYDQKISRLEAFLHISQGDKTMILSIVNGKDYPEIKVLSDDLPSVALRGENKEPITNVESKNNTEKVTKVEYYRAIQQPQKDIATGLDILVYDPDNGQNEPVLKDTTTHKITYKVAEIYGAHNIYLNVNYWQEGKTKMIKSQTGEQKSLSLAPLVQVYNYQKD